MNELDKAKTYLIQTQNSDGGWGYYAGKRSSPEPTIYAALALGRHEGREKDSAHRALDWLATQRKPDGALALSSHLEDHWSTLLYLLSLVRLAESPVVYRQVVEWTLKFRSTTLPDIEEVKLDNSLVGWGWAWGTFGWVEPTSYAILALKLAGLSDHQRVREGIRLLLDRVCTDGGWNYGNREVLGHQLTSYVPTTALALLALQNESSAQAVINRGLAYLRREIGTNQSTLNLALSMLCFNAFDEGIDDLRSNLLKRQAEDGSWRGNAHLTALAALALQATDDTQTKAGGALNAFQL